MKSLPVEVGEVNGLESGSAACAEWDRYVHEHPGGTFFHLAAWARVVKRAFGHRVYLLQAKRGDQITGVLPLGFIKSPIFGKSLISAPYCVYGGVLADSSEDRLALEAAARSLAEKLKVSYVEYRNREAVDPSRPTKSDLYVTFRKRIADDMEQNLLAIPRKQRAMVRKGIKAGLVGYVDKNVDRLFEAYSESVRNLGTPVYSKRYFSILLEEFGEQADIVSVTTKDGTLVASVLNFYFREEVLPYYGGGTFAARSVYGNDFLYYEVMRRAVEKGCSIFDYGRSKVGTGSYRFKKHWGFEPEPLYYEYDLVSAKEMPNISPTNPKFELMVKTWKRLPLPVSRRLGPLVARDLA